MPDNNYDKNCGFSEQAISYLYGEISLTEKTVFERHLKTCANCTDDIAGFGSARTAVAYWKTEEFELLETPSSAFLDSRNAARSANASPERRAKKTWLIGLTNFFKPSPVWAAGLMLFLFFGGLLLFVQNSRRDVPIVEIDAKKTNQTADSSKQITAENVVAEDFAADINQNSASRTTASNDSAATAALPKDKNNGIEKVSIIEVNKSATSNKNLEQAASRKIKSVVRLKSDNLNFAVSERRRSVDKKQILKLNNIEDVEEDEAASLRLTDLLDEVGGK